MIAACLEEGPEATGVFLPDLPGCWAFGRTRDSALQKAAALADAWPAWLHLHRLAVDVDLAGPVTVAEVLRVDYNPALANKPEPLFWSEMRPVGQSEIERALRLMRAARIDLLKLVQGVGAQAYDYRPPFGPRSIGETLEHIANAEWWYVTRLEIALPARLPRDPLARLTHVRAMVEDAILHLPRDRRHGVYQPVRYTAASSRVASLWTARKVLRRFVDHERLHTRWLVRTLHTWSTSG